MSLSIPQNNCKFLFLNWKKLLIAFSILTIFISIFLNSSLSVKVIAAFKPVCDSIAGSTTKKTCFVQESFGAGILYTSGARISSLRFIWDSTSQKILGAHACSYQETKGVFNLGDIYEEKQSQANNNCPGVGLKGRGVGDNWNGKDLLSLETFQASIDGRCSQGNLVGSYRLRLCSGNYYVTNISNDKTIHIPTTGTSRLITLNNESDLVAAMKAIKPAPFQPGSDFLTVGTPSSMVPDLSNIPIKQQRASVLAPEMLTKVKALLQGKNCISLVNSAGKIVFECSTSINGAKKYYNLKGEELAAGCQGFIINTLGTKPDLSEATIEEECVKKEEVEALSKDEFNTAQRGLSVEDPANNINKGAGTFESILGILFNIVAAILVIIIYFFGSAASIILYMLSSIFIFILSINPADPLYLNAAARPWQVLIGLANLVTLSTFIIVGIGYILNLESFKVKIQQFILNIAIFSLLLQLTLQGSALFVNVANGLGDVLVAAYAGVENGQPNKKGLVNFFSNSMNTISIIRCGKWNGENYDQKTGAEDPNCDINSTANPNQQANALFSGLGDIKEIVAALPSALSGSVDSRPVQLFIMETVFFVTVLYAIFLMFKGVQYVVFRVVGLWLLMVVSPLALGLYFSPLKTLKKYGSDWLDKFWRLSLSYPAFILGLVIISRLVTGFSEAVKKTLLVPSTPAATGGATTTTFLGDSIPAYAQSSSVDRVILFFIFACLVALVAIGSFSLLLTFMETVFGALAKALFDGIKKGISGVTGAFKGVYGGVIKASKIAGTTSRIAGKVVGSSGSLFGAAGMALETVGLKGLGGKLRAGGDKVAKLSDAVFAIPDYFSAALQMPADAWEGIKAGRKLETEAAQRNARAALEYASRKTGAGVPTMLARTGKYSTFAGQTKDDLSLGGFSKRIGEMSAKAATDAIPSTDYTLSQLNNIANDRDAKLLNLDKPADKQLFYAALKNPITAQKILENPKYLAWIKKNLDTMDQKLVEELVKEYPIPELGGNLSTLSLEDAKKVNATFLAKYDAIHGTKNFEELVGRYPAVISEQPDFDPSAASKLIERNTRQKTASLKAEGFSPEAAAQILNTVNSSVVRKPNMELSQMSVLSHKNAMFEADGHPLDPNDPEFAKKYEEGVRRTFRHIAANSIFGKTTVDNNESLKALSVSDFETEFNSDFDSNQSAALEKWEKTTVGKNLLKEFSYVQATDLHTKAAMMRETISASIQTQSDLEQAAIARMKSDGPLIAKLKQAADTNTQQLKQAARLLEGIAKEGSHVHVFDTALSFTAPSIERVGELQEALSSGDYRIKAVAANIGAQGLVTDVLKAMNASELGVSAGELLQYKQGVANIVATTAELSALQTHATKMTAANIQTKITAAIAESTRINADIISDETRLRNNAATLSETDKATIQNRIDQNNAQITGIGEKIDLLGHQERNVGQIQQATADLIASKQAQIESVKSTITAISPDLQNSFNGLNVGEMTDAAIKKGSDTLRAISNSPDPYQIAISQQQELIGKRKEVIESTATHAKTGTITKEQVQKII